MEKLQVLIYGEFNLPITFLGRRFRLPTSQIVIRLTNHTNLKTLFKMVQHR